MLVGFSYGGLVAAGVPDRVPERVAMLVYLDAFVPVSGRSMFDLMPASMRAGLAAALSSGHGWQMPPIPLSDPAFARRGRCWSGPVARTRALARRGPHPDRNVPRAGRPLNPRALDAVGHITWDAWRRRPGWPR